MPRRNGTFVKGGLYHIYNRGAGRFPIFFDHDDYELLEEMMRQRLDRYQITVVAYCLMPNHYHLLLRQEGKQSLHLFVGRLFNAYSQKVNRRYRRTGTLFEGRFQHKPVVDRDYLLQLCLYIHANPVTANLVNEPGAWPYSNFLEWVGVRASKPFDARLRDSLFPQGLGYGSSVREYLSAV